MIHYLRALHIMAVSLAVLLTVSADARAMNLEMAQYVVGFSNLIDDQYIAPLKEAEDDFKHCPTGEEARCERCPITIHSLELVQGIAEPDLSRINALIDAYVQHEIVPYSRELCALIRHKRKVMLEGYVAFYSPQFISIAFPADVEYNDRIKTLNLDVASGKTYALNDVIAPAMQKTLLADLAQKDCRITLHANQPFTFHGWSSYAPNRLAIYLTNDPESQAACPMAKQDDGEEVLYIDNRYLALPALRKLLEQEDLHDQRMQQ